MSDSSYNNVGLFYTRKGTIEDGLLDQLMLSIESHLDKQYNKQRLRGADYAQVYAQFLESALGNTTQYLIANLLLEENSDKIRKEIELMDKQLEQADKEIEKMDKEIEILGLQIPLTSAQIDKINAEIDYLEAQKEMMDAQKLKIDKEIEFLDAKIRTEYANTISSYADSNSLIGLQKRLLSAQRLGFAGDLQAKAAKMHADYDGIAETVNETGLPTLRGNALTAIDGLTGISGQIVGL